jgi:hypothetical protein
LQIKAADVDPDVAADLANSVAQSYIDFNLDNRVSSSRNTLRWMSDQKLEAAEEEFLAYQQNEKLFSLAERQAGFTEKIADLNDIFIQNRNQRVEAITKLEELEPSDGSSVGARHIPAR